MKLILKNMLWLSVFIVACEREIAIDLPISEPRLVVEGWILDDRDTQTITLSRSAPYLEANSPLAETQAEVVVTTDDNETFTYDEGEAGTYRTQFRGKVGQRYTLTINTREGERYVSTEQLLRPVAPLDSVYVVFKDADEGEEAGYYPAWSYTDPKGSRDHYRWRFYVNDTLHNQVTDLLVLSDEYIDGETIADADFLSITPLRLGDTLTIEQLSLSREALDFFLQLQRAAVQTGGVLATSPDPVRANVTNLTDDQDYALGFFGASSVVRASTIVGK